MVNTDWNDEVKKGNRFKFGENWKSFVKDTFNESTISGAIEATKSALKNSGLSFENLNVIDIGCGSGLFSLVALKLGAKHVTCFDYDPDSVNCTKELLRSQNISDDRFTCMEGNVLDEDFIKSLGKFDLVYSWGVLHHTGNLNKAILNASFLVDTGGFIFVALYQKTFLDYFWKIEKKLYSSSNKYIQSLFSYLWITKTKISFAIKGLSFKDMVASYKSKRGMNYYKNVHDWLGGYPYEGISSKQCISLFNSLGFEESYVSLPGKYWALSSGCNEYIFKKM
tara:strand:+ start:12514 stop:13356 length:843 start_codon:yes stop_codon:yes gene_type:complete